MGPSSAAPGGLGGLSSVEARLRVAAEGPNSLPSARRKTWLRIVAASLAEPMFLLLGAAVGLYLLLGDLGEASVLAASMGVVVAITVVQQGRTERALEALRDLTSPRAHVLRDGMDHTVPATELVRGDVIRIAEGDRVPADAILRAGTIVTVDESILTGEAVPVEKAPDLETAELGPPGSTGPALYSGSLVTSGRAIAEVVATGVRTELGKIGASLDSIDEERTPLGREVDHVARRTAVVAVLLAVLLAVLRWRTSADLTGSLLSGVTVAMSLLPEELPVVLTVFMALGAHRLSKRGVLTRRLAAVEALGSVQVLCTDKTGTLTQNRMAVRRLVTDEVDFTLSAGGDPDELPEAVHALVENAILASPRDPFDPMEKAFHALGQRALASTEHLHPAWHPVREYPLTSELLAVTHAWRADHGGDLVIATKGAPDAVFDLCHLPRQAAERWHRRVDEMAEAGLRVLAVAQAPGQIDHAPPHAHDVPFAMVGLVGLEDPIRPDAAPTIATARRAGIRVLMITGDHARTAASIADQAGLGAGTVLTGADIDAMDDDALGRALLGARAVARATPRHKLRIVRALAARGEVVGMTGDGVNDAPALRAAHIGIAMGARGTDVAREAAGLVLATDDFGSLVEGVRMGRRIWDNLRKAVRYVVAVHVPIAGIALVPAMLGWEAVLSPMHVVFLELIIDPACSIVFELEPADPAAMSRPPRPKSSRLFAPHEMLVAAVTGTLVFLAAFGLLGWGEHVGIAIDARRTASFVALVSGNLAMLFVDGQRVDPLVPRRPTGAVLALFVVAAAALIVLTTVPAVAGALGMPALGHFGLVVAALAGAAPIALYVIVSAMVAWASMGRSMRPGPTG